MRRLELEWWRYSSDADSTLSYFLWTHDTTREHLCYGLEDAYRAVKVPRYTRIPQGRYRIELQRAGTLHAAHLARYGAGWHVGMLMLQDVPGFSGVCIHSGNTEDDTEGCPLIGLDAYEGERTVGRSRAAYAKVYPRISRELMFGREVFLNIRDLDRWG